MIPTVYPAAFAVEAFSRRAEATPKDRVPRLGRRHVRRALPTLLREVPGGLIFVGPLSPIDFLFCFQDEREVDRVPAAALTVNAEP